MDIVDELKQFGAAHARAQDLTPRQYRAICARITHDGAGPGSWVGEWSRAAEQFVLDGRDLDACRYYNLARFPYPDSPAKQDALHGCVDSFARWAARNPALERLAVETPDGTVYCWTTGLSATEPRPLLIALGGIVSVKEQWAPLLEELPRLGLAGVVTEMPGVGENAQRYTPDSWKMLSAVLDAVADRAQVDRTFAMALSFSGHLAMRCALGDSRIRGIATVGAPVRNLFADPAQYAVLPRITVATVARLAGLDEADLPARLPQWALSDDELAAVDIPVYYVASRRDEIIPASDVRLIAEHVSGARVLEFDDEHGAPHHSDEVRMWLIASILRTQGGKAPLRRLVTALWALLRARRAVTALIPLQRVR